MKRTLTYQISEQYANMPIGLYLKSMGFSVSIIIALKKIKNSILLNGSCEYVNKKIQTDDILTIHYTEEVSSPKIPPVALPLSIVYEDEDLMVLNKPANMPIHPSLNNYENTLANGLAWYFQEQNTPFVFRCVNRLDRDTSGLTIIAKHMLSAGILSQMIANRQIKRLYQAIVHGILPNDQGTIDAPIARHMDSTIERVVDFEKGESAVTHYKVLSRDLTRNLSLIELSLETGRTHQIRVHMKYLGYPLIGDFLYYPDMTYINRQALHSASLSFLHPITKEPMQFSAPVPDDMLFMSI